MSTELATRTFSTEEVGLIKQTICKGATDTELALFLQQCKRTGLDPFSRQIHAVKRWDATQQREVMSMQTGIDGFRLIAERTGKYAGNDDPQFDVENAPHPNKATVTVWKLVEGTRVPFTRSARWSEFVQTKKGGEVTRFWLKMPYLMLGKVAEALALRAAFPQELSGLYTSDEMGQADEEHEPSPPSPPPRPVQDLKHLPGVKSGDDLKPPIRSINFAACGTLDELRTLWIGLTPAEKEHYADAKDERKAALTEGEQSLPPSAHGADANTKADPSSVTLPKAPKKLTANYISDLIAAVAETNGEDETDLIGALFASVMQDADSLDTASPDQLQRADKWLRERATVAA